MKAVIQLVVDGKSFQLRGNFDTLRDVQVFGEGVMAAAEKLAVNADTVHVMAMGEVAEADCGKVAAEARQLGLDPVWAHSHQVQ